ncbi:MAG: hypothetical protein ACKOUR_08330, partial [Planctomycetota bacterium]
MSGEGDMMVQAVDADRAPRFTYITTATANEVDLTNAIRYALQQGWTRLSIRVAPAPGNNATIKLRRASTSNIDTRLEITTAEQTGVRGDLLDSEGHLLAEGKTILDLRRYPAGTFYLRVFNPRADLDAQPLVSATDSRSGQLLNPTQVRAVGDGIYFVTNKLWRSNGRAIEDVMGTHQEDFTSIDQLTVVGNVLYFTAAYQPGLPTRRGLFKVLGTEATKVEELVGNETNFVAAGDKLFYTSGLRLLTQPATDLKTNPLNLPATPSNFTAAGNRLYFLVDNSTWVSDGTRGGTKLITNVQTGSRDSENVIAVGSRLFYFNQQSLADGTVRWDLWTARDSVGQLIRSFSGTTSADLLGALNN